MNVSTASNRDLRELCCAMPRGAKTWWLILLAQMILIPIGVSDVVALQMIVDRVIIKREVGLLLPILGVFATLMLVVACLEAFLQYRAIRLSQYWDVLIKGRLLRRIVRKPLAFFSQLPSGEILYRFLNDTGVLPAYLTEMRWSLATNAAQATCLLGFLMYADLPLAILVAAGIPLQVVALRRIGLECRRLMGDIKARDQQLLGYVDNMISSVEAMKALALEDKGRQEWLSGYRERIRLERRLAITQQIYGGAVLRLSGLTNLAAVAIGAHRIVTGVMSIGELVFFVAVNARLAGPVAFLATYQIGMQDIVTCVRRVRATWELLESQHSRLLRDSPNGSVPSGSRCLPALSSIKLSRVSYSYQPARMVLQDVNLEIRAGDVIKLEGDNGAGKSTLMKLISSLLMPTSGMLCVNETPATLFSDKAYRRMVLYVPAQSFWFKGTVAENIRGRADSSCSSVELEKCLQLTGADRIIQQLPQRWNTIVAPGGANLSRGEQQRLALTRALLQHPKVLLLDEAISALNHDDAADVLRGVQGFLGQRASMIYVHHGIHTCLPAERVIRVQNGLLYQAS